MNNKLKDLLAALEKLNNFTSQSIVSQQQWHQKKIYNENIEWLDEQVSQLIKTLKEKKFSTALEKQEHMGELYVNINTYTSHLEEMRNLTEKFIGLYREKVFIKDFFYE